MSGPPVLAACDLDRTAVWSPSALGLVGPDEDAPTLVCVETYQAQPLSFLTLAAYADLTALTTAGALVPVTTRTVEQYRRIRLPGPPPRWAVCANGGRLLVDGVEDTDHSRWVDALVAVAAPVGDVERAMAEVTRDDPAVTKRRVAQGLFCYLVLDPDADPAPLAAALTDLADPCGWVVSVQGRKIYVLPAGLTKSATLLRVVQRAGAASFVAAGDAHLDADMLEASYAGLVPRGSELDVSGWTRPHVGLTRRPGVLGGEEVVAWLRRCTEGREPGLTR